MARKIIETTEYTDDLDGSVATGTMTFSFEGTSYEIDLSKSNARAFEKAMKPYIDNARRARASRSRTQRRIAGAGSKRDLGAIREWATSNGFEVSTRGRIAGPVIAAYEAAH